MPLYGEMMRRMVLSLPPLSSGAHVLDFLGGSGAASAAIARVYPEASISVLDASPERLKRAATRFQQAGLAAPRLIEQRVRPDSSLLTPEAPAGYDLIVAALALHCILEHVPASSPTMSAAQVCADRASQFVQWISLLYRSLKPGGHLFVCDHTGQIAMFAQMQTLQQVGFTDVEAAWRVDDTFVVGCRRPVTVESASTAANAVASSQLLAVASSTPSSSSSSTVAAPASAVPAPSPAPLVSTSVPTVAAPPSASAVVASPDAVAPAPPTLDDEEFNKIIAALQAQNEELKARLAAPTATTGATSRNDNVASDASSSSSTSASSSASGDLAPALLSKLPLLFSRFDPSRSGQLTYAALQSLCRAVGRDGGDADDVLWWTYQSVAQPDQQSGNVGLVIEDLLEHFYKTGVWNLEHDLRQLKLI